MKKLKKGLSDDPKVKAALRKANESINEGKVKARAGDYVKTIAGMAQIEKIRGSIAFMKLPGKKTKGYWMNDLKNLKPTEEKEKGKTLWTESVNEVRIVGYDKSYLKNAKKRLKVPHEITKIEYKRTPLRSGVQDKFVRIWFKLKWKPGRWFDPEEHWVSVFYDSPERLKMIGKTLKLKLKESVNEDNIKFSKEEMAQLHKDGKLEKGGHTIEFGESVNESDLGLTYKKGKTVKVTHKKSGKELVIIDKPNVKREYEKIGYFAEGKINEGFEKYHLGGLGDSKLKNRLERAIKIWGGKVDAVGDDYIKFRLGSFEVKKFPSITYQEKIR